MTLNISHVTLDGPITETQWGEAHGVTMATGKLLGRSTASAGAVEEITVGSGLSLSGGTLTGGGHLALPTRLASNIYLITPTDNLLTAAVVANRLIVTPVFVGTSGTAAAIGIDVTTAGAGGTTARLGIYQCLSTNMPGTLILDAGAVATSSIAAVEASISQALTAGWYFLAAVFSGTPTVRSAGNSAGNMGMMFNNTSLVTGQLNRVYTYGALPSDETGQTYTVNGSASPPAIWLRG